MIVEHRIELVLKLIKNPFIVKVIEYSDQKTEAENKDYDDKGADAFLKVLATLALVQNVLLFDEVVGQNPYEC